jgi:MscS family membrane protein
MLEFVKNILVYKELVLALQMVVIIGITLFLALIVERFIDKVEEKLTHNKNIWDDLLLRAAKRPVKILIWAFGALLSVKVLGGYFDVDVSSAANLAKNLVIIFCLSRFLWRTAAEYEEHLEGRKNIDITTVMAIMKLVKASIIIATTLMLMQSLGVNISGILAFGGISGIAVGFAAKDLLANFFGAMMIYLDRPFSVGDWVRSPDREIEGTVEAIGWRLTRIRTFDSRLLYVPNSVFSSISIENPSRMSNRRIYETIGVRYDDVNNVGKIVDQVEKMLGQHPEINQGKTLMVYLNKFNEYSVDFFVYCFTKTKEWEKFHAVKQDVLLKVNEIISENGGEIAFPTSIVNVDKLPEKYSDLGQK